MSQVLTDAQLTAAWVKAGGDPSKAPMAIAISRAESGGRVGDDVVNHNTDGSIDRGPWQINSVHGAQSSQNLATNAKAAVAISNNGSDWSAWTTFTNGAYKKFLGASAPAARSSTPAPSPAAAPTVAATQGTDLFSDETPGLKYATVWIAVLLGGLAVAAIGLNRSLGGAPAQIASKARTGAKTAAIAAVVAPK